MKHNKIIILALMGVVLFSGCSQQSSSNDIIISEKDKENIQIEKQSYIYSNLNATGITSLVDITDQRVLVRFSEPDDTEKEKVYYLVFGLAARASPVSTNIQIETYKNGKLLETVTVKMSYVLDLLNEKITLDEFKNKIDTQTNN